MRLSHRGLWLHAKVIPAAFPNGNLCHFWKGVNAELDPRQPWKLGSPHRELTAAINLGNLVIPYQASSPTPQGWEAAAG